MDNGQSPDLSTAYAFEARFSPHVGKDGDALAAVLASARAVIDQPGLIQYYVLRPRAPSLPIVAMTLWESEAAFSAWTRSEAFARAHSEQNMEALGRVVAQTDSQGYHLAASHPR